MFTYRPNAKPHRINLSSSFSLSIFFRALRFLSTISIHLFLTSTLLSELSVTIRRYRVLSLRITRPGSPPSLELLQFFNKKEHRCRSRVIQMHSTIGQLLLLSFKCPYEQNFRYIAFTKVCMYICASCEWSSFNNASHQCGLVLTVAYPGLILRRCYKI